MRCASCGRTVAIPYSGGEANAAGGEAATVPREVAERVLRRAIELHAEEGGRLRLDDVYGIARELDVGPEYVQTALREEHGRAKATPREEDAEGRVTVGQRIVLGVAGVGMLALGLVSAMYPVLVWLEWRDPAPGAVGILVMALLAVIGVAMGIALLAAGVTMVRDAFRP